MKGKKLSLIAKIGIGFAFGILLGVLLGNNAKVISPIGDLFIKLLQMLILPLVFSAIVSGITNIPEMKSLFRMGLKAFVLFVLTTACAIATGLIFGNIFQVGLNSALKIPMAEIKKVEPLSFINTILNMVPTNIFASFSNNSMLQVIVFAFFFGICIVLGGQRTKAVGLFFDKVAQVMYKMVDVVIGLAPYGVAALIATIVGQYGLEALLPLGKYIIVFHIAILFFILIEQGPLIFIGSKLNPIKFFKAIFGAISLAFVTCSSAAALPVAMKELEHNVGISETVSSFVMPVGTNVNKNGSALYQGSVAMFIAQIMGIQLSFTQQITVLITALLASIGTAGVPAASLVMLSMTLSCVGLPLEAIALMAGIDRILDGIRTVPNVIGNAVVTSIIARQEGEELSVSSEKRYKDVTPTNTTHTEKEFDL